ncbi:uncharacterized protein isoform X2 [Leptinotarsa decemlineata]|uniref:uncharacterized protein isoform X2 n=1 Tax=Leptinotarsa decemlineata TaxID=7539 RepID=UPI003D30BCB2
MSDDFDIKSLPSHFVSVSRPSEVIKKLNEKREDEHDTAIKSMREQMQILNIKTNEDIKKISEICIEKLKRMKQEAEDYLSGINEKYKTLSESDLEEDVVNNTFNKLSETNEIQLKTVDDLHEKLVSIEKNRSEEFKKILKVTKEKIQTISYRLPFRTDEFFENELVNINQITLSNYQSYAELQKQLKLQVKNDMKTWSEELLEFKEKLKSLLKILAKKSVVRIQSTLKQDANAYISTDLTKEIMKIKSLHTEMQWYMNSENDIPISHEEVERWLNDVRKTLASLDQSAKNLVNFYKSIIIILFNRFFGELEDLKETMTKTGIVKPEDIEEFQSEIYTPAIDEINIQFHNDFEKLTMFEIELNIVLEKLRQSPNEKKLENHFDEAITILDNLEKLYNSHCVSETQVLQKYKTMMDIEIEVLMSEIKRFLVLHPPDAERDPKKQRKRASQTVEVKIDPNENLVPRQILYCTYQVDAVKNWMFGLWEAINQYLSTCRTEILVVTDQWMEKQAEKINERLKVKIAFHKPRYQTTKYTIYEKRLMELRKHSKRISSHKLAAEEEIQSLRELKSLNDQKFADVCNQFTLKKVEILNEIKYLPKSHLIRGRFQVVHPMFKNHERMLQKIEIDYRENSLNFLERLKISDYKFIKASKLFSEGGNFNIEELDSLQKNLNKLEHFAETAMQKCIDEEKVKYGKYYSQLSNVHTEIVSSFNKLIEELEHNETIVEVIKKLQKIINNEDISVQTQIKRIDGEIKNIIEIAEENVGNEEYLNSFSELFLNIIADILNLYKFLEPSKRIDTYPVSHIATNKSSMMMKSKSDRHTNYSGFLFDMIPIEEHTFLSKLNVLLYTSFVDIQNKAKEFYNKHHNFLLDTSKIQQTYDDCMEEVLNKFNTVKFQYYSCRQEHMPIFLTMLNNFKKFKHQYIRDFRNKFYRLSISRCTLISKKIFSRLNEDKENVRRTFYQIFNKLKALYGHPRNRDLLEDLRGEFNTMINENEEIFQKIPHPLIEFLEKVHEEESKKFKIVDTMLRSLYKDERLELLVEEIKTQLDTNCHSVKYTITDEQSEESGINEKSASKLILDYLSNGLLRPPDSTDMKSPTVHSVSTEGTYDIPEEYLNELERTISKSKESITEFVETQLMKYEEDLKEIWNSELNFILDLYNVKYDEKNIF